MARQIGGGDNVMGSKEAIVNVSFKDDLGNILENASRLKDVLDAVNSNFIAINSAVGMTTNSMGKLASQTQRLVATTQQLRNEYQTIADASQRIGLSQSISMPNNAPFQNTQVVRDAISGTGEASGLILPGSEQAGLGSTGGLRDYVTSTYPQFRSPRNYANPLRDSEVRAGARWQDQADALQQQYDIAEASNDRTTMRRIRKAQEAHNFRKPQSSSNLPEYFSNKDKRNTTGTGIPTQMWEDYQAGASASSIFKGLLTSSKIPAFQAVGAAVPYITAGFGAAAAAYKAMDYLVKGATRYSGLTGGTGVFENTGAAAGSQTFIGLQSRAWLEGLTNMAIGPGGYQQIQEGLLGAGYTARDNAQYNKMGIRGLRYQSARSSLAQMYAMGLQDVDQNLQLMQMVVERGNGSLTSLIGTIDNLREVALTSNASLKVMMQTMTASIQGLIGGMNMSGGTATFVGGTNAAAYANSQNTLLRGSGAPDFNNVVTQIMLTQSSAYSDAGINMQNLFYAMARPENYSQGLGMLTAQATDQTVDQILGNVFNIPQGASAQEAKDIMAQNTPGVMALMQDPRIKAIIKDPAIYTNVDSFLEWAATNLTGDPQTASAEASRKANLSRTVDISKYSNRATGSTPTSATGPTGAGGNYGINSTAATFTVQGGANAGGPYTGRSGDLSRSEAIDKYLAEVFKNQAVGGDFSGGFDSIERQLHPITGAYYDYVQATGQSVGWIEKVLKNKDGAAAGNTYVKFGDKVMSLKNFMVEAANNKDYQAMLDGTSDTQLMVAEKKAGQKQSELTGWTNAGEYGGGGAMGEKAMSEMTQNDFTQSFRDALKPYTTKAGYLSVMTHDVD